MLVRQFRFNISPSGRCSDAMVARAFFTNTQKSHKDQLKPNIIGRVLPTGGIFKQECEVSAKLKLTPVTLVYQGLQVFLLFK